jgi:uncharacterized protein (TIGR03437 family)
MRSVLLVPAFLFAITGWSAAATDPAAVTVVSAANPTVGVTADSLASIFGSQLSTQTAIAPGLPWPYQLGDIQVVYVRDSAGKMPMAAIFYVSPSQVNIWIPPGIAPGAASVEFPFTGLPPGVGTAALHVVPVNIRAVAPGLFSADGTGTGAAGASAIRVVIPTNFQSPVPVFSCDSKGCVTVPIDVGVDAPVYLSLYGTGIRGASSPDNVFVTIGNTQVKPTYVGPQTQIPGLDQVNVPMPLSLRGSGLANVTVTVDGVVSNAVQISIQ